MARREAPLGKNVVQPRDEDEPATNADEPTQKACRGAKDKEEEARVGRLLTAGGVALIGLGLSISLDELAIGFTLGLSRVPVAAAVILIAVQAFVVSQIGFQVGRQVGGRFREGAERLAGIVLIALGGVLLVSKFLPLPV